MTKLSVLIFTLTLFSCGNNNSKLTITIKSNSFKSIYIIYLNFEFSSDSLDTSSTIVQPARPELDKSNLFGFVQFYFIEAFNPLVSCGRFIIHPA
jgi:hypothetical protein